MSVQIVHCKICDNLLSSLFISECRIAGELIALLRLLRLRDILRATIASKKFKDIWEKTYQREVIVLENNEFWKYLFTLCCSLYAPMRIF